ncbi:GntR family transcriptional regulator [Desulfoluna limicola]|uniref:GntR family transcriptional regulator n=1 Tax=Desulfoluna limicola TaxID=2810562 RepID=A0ABN6F4N1_9BACT|nr:GntR family transcriptional regulator [Desulfoluna limicola]BCS96535.1 GntR family transcriptional regulator [Desulfoluna limicola]
MDNNASSMKSLVAYEKIRDMILTGVKLPGTRLVLSDLETELGIGRGPIREALMRLDRSGLVKNIPYKGAVVASPPSRKEIGIIFDIRVELEAQLAVEAMNNISPDQIAKLEDLHGRMASVDADFYALDREFHSIIYEASNLPHLCTIVHKLIESVEAFLNLYRQEITDCHKFSFEHGQILEAIKEKDEERVRTVLKNNIRSGLEVVERSFSRLVRKPV